MSKGLGAPIDICAQAVYMVAAKDMKRSWRFMFQEGMSIDGRSYKLDYAALRKTKLVYILVEKHQESILFSSLAVAIFRRSHWAGPVSPG